MSSGVYVLQLKDTSKYYVGKSNNIESRINNHKQCNSKCAKFVKINGGVHKVLKPLTPPDNNLSNWEKDETLIQMIKHGYNNVRGWEFTNISNLNKEELDIIKISIFGLGDRCRKCGNNGHFAKECNSTKAKWLQSLEECYTYNNTSSDIINTLLDSPYEESPPDNKTLCESKTLYESKCESKCDSKINNINTLKDTDENIIIEIAKTSRAKCQLCKELINKGEYRVGIEYEFKGKISTKWNHEKCYNIQNPKVKPQQTNNLVNKNKKVPSKKSKNCTRCGRNGHNENECFAETDVDGYELIDEEDCCYRCGYPGHYANNCYAKKHIDGFYIKD